MWCAAMLKLESEHLNLKESMGMDKSSLYALGKIDILLTPA